MLRKGARVYFQDYNEDSLEKATLPTIVVNCGVDAVNRCAFPFFLHARAKLICAEWSQTAAMIPEPKVDLILASDTIYTPATIRAFISVVNQIATPDTMVVIASQRYYFGLGGGTQALNALIEELHLPLRVEVLKTLGTDSVKRDIIRLIKCAASPVFNKHALKDYCDFSLALRLRCFRFASFSSKPFSTKNCFATRSVLPTRPIITSTSFSSTPSSSTHFFFVSASIACSFGTALIVTNDMAVPSRPARAVRPTRWM